MPILNESDQVLLESCMDEIRNVVGDTISEKHLVETIMKHKFDCAKALDVILNNTTTAATSSSTTTTQPPPQSAVPMETGNHKIIKQKIYTKIHVNCRFYYLFFFFLRLFCLAHNFIVYFTN